MLFINCEISLNLTWSEDCVISSAITFFIVQLKKQNLQ